MSGRELAQAGAPGRTALAVGVQFWAVAARAVDSLRFVVCHRPECGAIFFICRRCARGRSAAGWRCRPGAPVGLAGAIEGVPSITLVWSTDDAKPVRSAWYSDLMPDKNKPAIPPPMTVAEYARFQINGHHLVDLLLRVVRKHEASENSNEKLDPLEKLAGVIAIAALAHLANGPEGPTEQKKRAEQEEAAKKAGDANRARAGIKL